MKRKTVNQVVKWYGGLDLLKDMNPTTLFDFLEDKYRGTDQIIKIVLNDNEGWLLFVDDSIPLRKQVMGYFYQKGCWLIDYFGDYLFRQDIGWCFYKDFIFDSAPKAEDFEKIVSQISAKIGCD